METHKDLIYPRVCGDPLFYFLHTIKFTQTLVLDTSLKKLFILKNIINLHCVKISTYNKHKNEQLDKKTAIFCFRQVVDKRLWSSQGLYRPLGCKKGLKGQAKTIESFLSLLKYVQYISCCNFHLKLGEKCLLLSVVLGLLILVEYVFFINSVSLKVTVSIQCLGLNSALIYLHQRCL